MSGFRNQMDDWKYLISKDNQSSRGFYLFITIVFALLFLCFTLAFIAACIGVVAGTWKIVGFIELPITIILLIIIVKVLSK